MLKTYANDYLAIRRAGLEAIHTGNALRSLIGDHAALLNCFELEAAAAAILASL